MANLPAKFKKEPDGRRGKNQHNESQKILILTEVIGMIKQGYPRYEIAMKMKEEWNLSVQQTDRYIGNARDLFAWQWNKSKKQLMADLLTKTEYVYQRAMEQDQFPAALGALSLIAKTTRITSKKQQ